MFGSLVKAVVDVQQELMVVDAELHSDEESLLLEQGSIQDYLWDINLHPDKFPQEDWIEFDSMINIRPALSNRSRYVENTEARRKIIKVVNRLVAP